MARHPRTQCELIPPILTAFAVLLGLTLALIYPWRLLLLYAAALPVPLTLLWASRSVPSPAERIAHVDEEHEAHAHAHAPAHA